MVVLEWNGCSSSTQSSDPGSDDNGNSANDVSEISCEVPVV